MRIGRRSLGASPGAFALLEATAGEFSACRPQYGKGDNASDGGNRNRADDDFSHAVKGSLPVNDNYRGPADENRV